MWVATHLHPDPLLLPLRLAVPGEIGGNGKCGQDDLILSRENESPSVLSSLISSKEGSCGFSYKVARGGIQVPMALIVKMR